MKKTIKTNEREFSGQVVSWLNQILQSGNYPFETVTGETSIRIKEESTRYPDTAIWLDRKAGIAFCFAELKTPDTPATDQPTLDLAAKKARAVGANFFLTWNMRDAVLWRTPKGIRHNVVEWDRIKYYPALAKIASIEDLWDKHKLPAIKDRAKEIIDDLVELYQDGHLKQIEPDTTYFVARLTEAVQALQPLVEHSLIVQVGKSFKFKKAVYGWAYTQGIINIDDLFYEMVSRQIAYRLLGRIIFYQALRRFRHDLPKMDISGYPENVKQALDGYFDQAKEIDYYAVFEPDITDTLPLTVKSANELVSLVEDLNRFNFTRMPQDVVGQVFEQLIPPEERHRLGQYFTPDKLVDLIVAFCVRQKDDAIADPTCGTGTFLIRAYDRLKQLGQTKHKELLNNIWGIDIAHFPAELATINLYRQDMSDYSNFPRVLAKDFFYIEPGSKEKFPPPKPGKDLNYKIEVPIPKFNAMVGNFPFIRQELIERVKPEYKDRVNTILFKEWGADFPKFSGQSDIYAYMFVHAAAHLYVDPKGEYNGRLGFITSNSWLDVAYGHELQKFFLRHFKIVAIIESRCEPWFEQSAVNTVVTILERCDDLNECDTNPVKFIKIKKRLDEIVQEDIKVQSQQRWINLERLTLTIENLNLQSSGQKYTYHPTEKGLEKKTITLISNDENDTFRARIVKQGELRLQVEASSSTVKWGTFLRAPDIYFKILHQCQDKLIPLNEIASIRRGFTTGINEFFYLTEEDIKHWEIEPEFLKPVIKSPKECPGLIIDPQNLKNKVFLCHKDKSELIGTNALKYILWGEKQKTKGEKQKRSGIPYPKVPTVMNRKLWYDLGEQHKEKVLIQKQTGDRFLVPYNLSGAQLDCNLYGLVFKSDKIGLGLSIYLNSTLAHLFRELFGRSNLGDGGLKTEEIDWAILYTPQIDILKTIQEKGKTIFNNIARRDIDSIFDEVKKKDRQELDKIIFHALGITSKDDQQAVYNGICELVQERLDLAKLRTKQKKQRKIQDTQRLVDEVIEELLPNLNRFPDQFLPVGKISFKEISVPAEKLQLGQDFFGKMPIKSDSGFEYQCDNIEEAKYMIYAQHPNEYIIKVPTNSKVIDQAVLAYERYLTETKDKLHETVLERVMDTNQADVLVSEIWQKLGLPEIFVVNS
ncbi:MAG: class I SAM-dependent DNA methyltransferase [bacterium]